MPKLIFITFILTIIFTRIFVFLGDKSGLLGWAHTSPYYLHHISLGLILVCIAGYLSLTQKLDSSKKNITAIIYGLGLGWIADEFSIWLQTQTNSWSAASYAEYAASPTFIPIIFVGLLLGIFLILDNKS